MDNTTCSSYTEFSPLAAVIITVYNKEKFLRDSIESVLRQRTDFPFAVILSEDCGEDKGREICREYAARYAGGGSSPVAIDISPESNLGLVANCYRCIRHALSLGVKYISQLDCDDIMADPDFLQGQVDALRKMPDCQAVYSDYFLIGENVSLPEACGIADSYNKDLLCGDALSVSPTDCERLLTSNNPMVAGAVTYRAENLGDFLKYYMCDDRYVSSLMTQDLPLWLFLSLYGSFARRSRKCIGYRDLETSISRSPDVGKMEAFQRASMEVRLGFLKLLEQDEFLSSLKRRGIRAPYFAGISGASASEKIRSRISALYNKKMLRHYAKLAPGRYIGFAAGVLRRCPKLLVSGDFIRSVGVFLKSVLEKSTGGSGAA